MAARRVTMPAADDIFRPTGSGASGAEQPRPVRAVPSPGSAKAVEPAPTEAKRPSGRVRHDEKMTVYITSEELLDLEHARLTLRREHGLAVDRGRLVREAIGIVLAELGQHGAESALVRRLADG